MKMKRAAVLLATVMILGLSACGGTKQGAVSGTESVAKAVSKLPELTKGGTPVDVGEFTVTIPEGWLGVTEEDVFTEETDGKSAAVTDAYSLVKGGKSKLDVALKPTVYINYYPNKTAEEKFESSGRLFEGTTEVDVTVGGKTYKGYHGESDISQEGDEPEYFKRDVLFIPATETGSFRIYIETYSKTEGQYEVYVTDEDVSTIIESLKANA